ncbi:MAG: cyclic nucleotide-binding domain-containing protein [Chloroherpetonaceae bacterium]|nr:cyclic nucleotide-binding domain-containing protein [Chloroherpetonaceae bacterium]MDW8437538.1 cyclic nucleotide-binding domain-containing protein [Chloroherpetonaceae bacterium]
MHKIDPSTIPIFEGISPEEFEHIIKYAFVKGFEPNYVLFRENLIVGQIMYVILSGKVELSKKNAAGEDEVFMTLGPGALLGEMSLFEQQKRSASAIVKEYSELLVMPKYNFDRMLQSRPTEAIKILLNFIKILSQRLRETTNRMIKAKSEAEAAAHAAAAAASSSASAPSAPPAPTPPERMALRDSAQKGNELYVLTLEELQNPNLYQILEQKRQQGLIADSSSRLLMIRDLVNYYLQLPMEELQLKVREMELRFRNRPRV